MPGIYELPINDRRESSPGRVGLVSGFTLSCYLRLIDDAAGRLERNGKANLSVDAASIFRRLGLDGDAWRERLERLRHRTRATLRLGRPRRRLASTRRFQPLQASPSPRPAIRDAAC